MSSNSRPAPPPVVNTNPPRPPRRPAPPPQQDAAPEPVTEQTQTEQPTATTAIAAQTDQGGMLASLLAAPGQDAGVTDSTALLTGLAAMRTKTIDPMRDYVGDGTRKLRWIQAAIDHQAALTGQSRQDLETAILLGAAAIEPQLLDVHYQQLYGRPRRSA